MLMLDQRTLMLVLTMMTLVLMAVMYLTSKVRQYPGASFWVWAAAVTLLANTLILLRNVISDLFSVVVGNVLGMIAASLLSYGIYQFLGRSGPRRLYLAVCAATAAGFTVFTFGYHDYSLRVLTYCLGMAVLFLNISWAIFRSTRQGGGRIYRFTAACFALFGLFQIVRAGLTLATGQAPALYVPSPLNSVNLMFHIFVYIAWMVGLPMMLSARLEADLEAHVADLRDEVRLRRQAEERLAREAALDPLTGLYNRRKFFAEAAKALSRARRHGQPLALITFDVDHFKEVNDGFGHEAGDQALQALAAFCQGRARNEDILARVGGEEFVLLLPDTGEEGARALAERLRQGLGGLEVPVGQGSLRLTASFGASTLQPGDERVDQLLKRADQALYAAKREGRNQVRLHQAGPGAAGSSTG